MPQDKQLRGISLDEVVEKRRLDQALNAKEFAVLAGVSYSAAREWFRLPGFPVFRGVVFWQDFVDWRKARTGLIGSEGKLTPRVEPEDPYKTAYKTDRPLPQRAAEILLQAG